jgi:hypothetical protein
MRAAGLISILLATSSVLAAGQQPDERKAEIERWASKQITFLSDSDPAYHYLEIIQKEAYSHDPQAFRWTNDEKQREAVRSLLQRLDNNSANDSNGRSFTSLFDGLVSVLNRTVPTRYEDPNSLAILQYSMVSVETAAGIAVGPSSRPRFGTLPAGTLNARTIAVPDSSSRLTVVNSALFSFCYEYLKLGLRTIVFRVTGNAIEMSYGDKVFDGGPRHDPELIIRLSKLLEDTVNHRQINSQAVPADYEDPLLIRMIDAIEFFLVAHEYGHIVLGHLSAQTHSVHTYGVSQPLNVLRRTWGQEAAADAYAFALLNKYLSSDAAKEDRYHAGIDFVDYLRLAPQFFFAFDSAAVDAQYVFDNKQLGPALSDNEKKLVVGYLETALSQEAKAIPITKNSKRGPKYSAAVLAVLNNDYPPAWARLALMQGALKKLSPLSNDPTDRAFRDFGISILANIEKMNSDLLPRWAAIMQKQ